MACFETMKQLRGFLGLSSYYRRFTKNYGQLPRPLTDLLKKDCFGWSLQAQKAFEVLKNCLCTALVLVLLDLKQLF